MDDITSSENEGQEGQGQEASGAQQDPIKNMKAEMDRKLGNVTEQLRLQSEFLQRTLDQMQASSKPATRQEVTEEEPDPVTDPVAYKERIKREVLGEVERKTQLSQSTQAEVARIQGLYPEFGEQGSEAAKLALQKFQSLPGHLKGTPEGAKLVLMEAAAEMGLVPASRRRKAAEAEDDYTVSGSSSQSSNSRRQSQVKVDDRTLAFAELIGLDVSKPETRKSLEARAQRKNWVKYE